MSQTANRFSPEMRARAARMVLGHESEHRSLGDGVLDRGKDRLHGEGGGLGSQEARIKEYVRHKGYPELLAMFKDNIAGGTDTRPGFAEMLKFLFKHRNENCIVIIDDITRLARDVEVHLKLRRAIAATGAKLERPSFEFGDSSDEELVELLLASVSQHQRRKNGGQVRNRMRGRLLNGYWCFASKPPAYQYAKVAGQNILLRREPIIDRDGGA